MSKRLYLHIGTHKTATTSVQHFFAKNRKALRRQGIFYPCQSIVGAPKHYAHHRVAHAISGKDPIMSKELAADFFTELHRRTGESDKAFLSAEPFYRHMMEEEGDDQDAPYARYIERVRQMTEAFDVKIMVMVRRQDLFAESLYSEHVLSTNYQRRIHTFLKEKAGLLDYAARMKQWAAVFGQDSIVLDTFEPDYLKHPVERLFVEWLGGTWQEDFVEVGTFNPTLSRAFVEYKRMLNFKRQGRDLNTTFRKWLTESSEKEFTRKLDDRSRYYLNPRQRSKLMETFEEGNCWLAQTYLQRDQLFRRPLASDIYKYTDQKDLSFDEYKLITKNLLRLLAESNANS